MASEPRWAAKEPGGDQTGLGGLNATGYSGAMKSPAIRHAFGLLKFLVPVAIIGWLLWRIDAEEWAALRNQPKNFGALAAALMVAMSALLLTLLRWGLLVRCNGIRLSYAEALRLGSIGFLLSFVSAGSVGGDLFKAIFLARRAPGQRVEAVASVAVDRAVGLYGLLLVVVCVMLVAPPRADQQIQQIAYWAAGLAAVGTLVLASLILGGRSIDRVVRRLGGFRYVGRLIHRVADPLRIFHTHPKEFLIAVVMSLGVHVLLSISIYLIARGLYADAPTLAQHLIIVPIAMLVSALPISPAGIGLLEAAMHWLYALIPETPTQASGTLVALVFEIVKILLALAGVVFYWTSGREVKESLSQAEVADV